MSPWVMRNILIIFIAKLIMPEMYRFLSLSESLSLAKMWFKLLKWDDTGLTWSFWAASEEKFADLCNDAEVSRILPVKHPPDQTLDTMEIFLRGIVLYSGGH